MATHSLNAAFAWGGAIGSIYKYSIKGMKWKACDATELVDAFMQSIPGRGDAGSLSIGVRWNKVGMGAIHTAAAARTTQTGTVTLPDGTTFACSAFVTGIDIDVPEDDPIDEGVEFKFTGTPTVTLAA